MELLYIPGLAALVVLAAFIIRSRREPAPSRSRSAHRAPPRRYDDDDDFEDDDDDDDLRYLPGGGRSSPAEKWAPSLARPAGQWKIHSTQEVKGLQYRRESARDFMRAAKIAERAGRPVGVRLEAEPGNAHDPNAQRVIGFAGEDQYFIGYLDAALAKEVAERFPPECLGTSSCGAPMRSRIGLRFILTCSFRPRGRHSGRIARTPSRETRGPSPFRLDRGRGASDYPRRIASSPGAAELRSPPAR